MVKYFIGTSGWHYDDWRGGFYPEKLPKSRWLEHYAQHFSTVELNNTFYRLPTEKAVAAWHDASPADFIFSVKVSRYITHIKRLQDCAPEVANFMVKIAPLKKKLGPLLYQLPPDMQRDDGRLEGFLSILPRHRRHVIEFRHKSWFDDKVFSILRNHNTAFCVYDMPDFTCPLACTADFAYVRFHGRNNLYSSKYSDKELLDWAGKIKLLDSSADTIYLYFNNDTAGYALDNALTIRKYLLE